MEDLRSKKFLLDVDGKYILLDKDHHFIYRDGYAEMLGKSKKGDCSSTIIPDGALLLTYTVVCLGFDSFMDHSCSPSTEQEYITKHEYVVRAKKIILPGEKITCDYGFLQNDVAKQKNLGTSFVCKCGESNCRGALVC